MDPMTSGGQQGATQSTSALGGGGHVSVSANVGALPTLTDT